MPSFRGKPACECLVQWLPVYEAELQRRGILKGELKIYQLIGGAGASAGTHKTGGAFDIIELAGDADVWVARQMGADATWSRTKRQGFTPHIHGVLRGCPHNLPARYQIDAVDAGYNGLGRRGRGGRDDGPKPLSKRTWQEGIKWAEAQRDWLEMASEEDVRKVVREELIRLFGDDQGDKNPSLPDIGKARVVNPYDKTKVWSLGHLLFYIQSKLEATDDN